MYYESDYLVKRKVKSVFNIRSNTKLSVIIPLRVSADRNDALERLQNSLLDAEFPREKVEIVVVNDGSPIDNEHEVIGLCKDNEFGYIGLDTELEYFSAARCRNLAASIVKSQYIFFQDVDLMPVDGFYKNLLDDIVIHKLSEKVNNFLMYGVVYLTEEASSDFKKCSTLEKKSLYFEALDRESPKIEKTSTCTSCILMSRASYLIRGGMCEDFNGWGYEDLEFETRIARLSRKFPLPPEWLRDIGSFSNIDAYVGWKSMLRLFGDLTWSKEGVLYHCYHPVDNNSKYKLKRKNNFELLQKYMKEFASSGAEPEPLPDMSSGKSLLFKNNVFLMNRGVQPFWGEIVFSSENDFLSEIEFLNFLNTNNITRVVFFNPYANENMLRFYKCCQENEINLVVAERGGLSNSFFYDNNGFLFDSSSYDEINWNKKLSDQQWDEITNWIRGYKDSGNELERQPDKVKIKELSKKLGVFGKKIILVPLQRPDDTVIKYFSGKMKDYDSFISQISKLVEELNDDWKVIYKKHPLEDSGFYIEGAICVDNYNVRDLISLADVVVTFNSGAGLTSLLYEKPVYVFGDAYYAGNGLARKVDSYQDLISGLGEKVVSKESIVRFFYYLVFEFYSFGVFHTKEVLMPEAGSRMTATIDIEPVSIKLPKRKLFFNFENEEVRYNFTSLMFDRYKNISNGNIISGKSPKPNSDFHSAPFALSFANACRLYHQGAYVEALSNIVKAIEVNPKDARAKRVAAEVLVKLKKHKEAIIFLKEARLLVPNNFPIKRRYWCLKLPILSFFFTSKPFPVPSN
jgi:predicted glycosyltransferase involved in capsule biosynthesis/tetratricopeptide (TPR) repeat protein